MGEVTGIGWTDSNTRINTGFFGKIDRTAQVLPTPTPPLTTRPDVTRRGLMPTVKHDRRREQIGEKNPNWRGGRTVASSGYVLIRMPGHPMADVRGYVYEHRLVASEMLGRDLLPSEQVHHRDGDKQNNSPKNLLVTESQRHHQHLHAKRSDIQAPDEPNTEVICACGCGTTFLKFDGSGRPRRFVSGHNARKRVA